jgi:hypothetical protein
LHTTEENLAEYRDLVRWALQGEPDAGSVVYALLAVADRLNTINNTMERKL